MVIYDRICFEIFTADFLVNAEEELIKELPITYYLIMGPLGLLPLSTKNEKIIKIKKNNGI